MIRKKRPIEHARGRAVVLYHWVFTVRPANAEPLLFAAEVKA